MRENNQILGHFKSYLRRRGNVSSTIENYSQSVDRYLNWAKNENLVPEQITYNDILIYIDYCKTEGGSAGVVNRKLIAIKHFYDFLQNRTDKSRLVPLKNPAAGIILKGATKRVINNMFTKEKREELFEKYQITDNRTHRNKIILGLLVYQGLTNEELHALKPEHINLKDGKIKVPECVRTTARTLKLNACQMMDFAEYLNRIRNEIIETGNAQTDRLFISMTGNKKIKSSIAQIFKTLRKINPTVKDPKQIRKSVICGWLKEYNLREVQYMAGHKWISSTERYQTENLEDLQKEIEKYHPLK
jgi:integrase/recombinase XerD